MRVVRAGSTCLLLEGDALPDEFLGEHHGVLEVHVVVPRTVHQVQLAEGVPRRVEVTGEARHVAFLVPLVVALQARLTHVPLRVHRICSSGSEVDVAFLDDPMID